MLNSSAVSNQPGSGAETRLWQAVIVNTIREWISGPLRLKREAEQYLFGDHTDFASVCLSAGMDVDRLRTELRRLQLQSKRGGGLQVPATNSAK
jgi:hypothetical protein